MKLATKLTLAFTALFFAILNIFGIFMIVSAFQTEMDDAVYEANDRVSAVENVLVTGKRAGEGVCFRSRIRGRRRGGSAGGSALVLSRSGRIRRKGPAGAPAHGIRWRLCLQPGRGDPKYGDRIATSLRRSLDVPQDMLLPGELLKQTIQRNGKERDLIVTGQFSFAGEKYTLVSLTDITKIYSARFSYIRNLVLFDTVGGALAALCILMVSRSITRYQPS